MFSNSRKHLSLVFIVCVVSVCTSPALGLEGNQVQYAYFNQTCFSTGGLICAPGPHFNFACSYPFPPNKESGICACTRGYVFGQDTGTCWPIPRADHHQCSYNVQCQAGKWGHYSRCNKRTARCECYADPLKHGRKLAYWRPEYGPSAGRCDLKNHVDLCKTENDCVKKIGAGSYCKVDSHYHESPTTSQYGSCQCKVGSHAWFPSLDSCLPLATKEGDDCQLDDQCTQGSLGKYSHCSNWSFKCECHPLQRGQRIRYYIKTGKCFLEKYFSDYCDDSEECRASLGDDAECDVFDKKCWRKRIGDFCNDDLDCVGENLEQSFCRKFDRLVASDNSGLLFAGQCAQTVLDENSSSNGLQFSKYYLYIAGSLLLIKSQICE